MCMEDWFCQILSHTIDFNYFCNTVIECTFYLKIFNRTLVQSRFSTGRSMKL